MNQILNMPQTLSLVDQENTTITYSETTLQLQARLGMHGGTTPISHIHRPRFRKLFDRHKAAYRH